MSTAPQRRRVAISLAEKHAIRTYAARNPHLSQPQLAAWFASQPNGRRINQSLISRILRIKHLPPLPLARQSRAGAQAQVQSQTQSEVPSQMYQMQGQNQDHRHSSPNSFTVNPTTGAIEPIPFEDPALISNMRNEDDMSAPDAIYATHTLSTPKRIRPAQWPDIEAALLIWIREVDMQRPVTGDAFKRKAAEIWNLLPQYAGRPPPAFSNGWMEKVNSRIRWRDYASRRPIPQS